MMNIKCHSCNTTFHDNRSLEIHYHYTHADKQTQESSGSDAAGATDSAETNNNQFFKFENICGKVSSSGCTEPKVMTAISPGISQHTTSGNEPIHNRSEGNYPLSPYPLHLSSPYSIPHASHAVPHSSYGPPPVPPEPAYILGGGGDDFSNSHAVCTQANSTTSVGTYPFSNDHRYHPYYKQGFREPIRNQPPISSPMSPHLATGIVRCDKCEYMCNSQDMLLHHVTMCHAESLGLHHGFHPHRFPNNGANEPQAEILDLDSHKVHVYQPPNGQENRQEAGEQQNTMLEPWIHDIKKEYYSSTQLNQQNGSSNNGPGGTPLPSPDFGNVSTTSENMDNLQPSVHSPFHSSGSQFDQSGQAGTSNQISSSDASSGGGKSSGKSSKGNGSWKSNEPRRPKTYNCSACNKWFTSSGHLKRHYNTTLHKNAVKQSGGADPATMPISAHHHPHKDPSYVPPSGRHTKNTTPTSSESASSSESTGHLKLNERSNYQHQSGRPSSSSSSAQPNSSVSSLLHSSPNLVAGPSDISGGLVNPHHPSYTAPQRTTPDLIKCPSPITSGGPLLHHSHPSPYLPFTATTSQHPHLSFFQQHTQTPLYPNFQSPHVSTTPQVIQNSHSGNLKEDSVLDVCNIKTEDTSEEDESKELKNFNPLPSFPCIQSSSNNNNNNDDDDDEDTWMCSQNFGLDEFFNTLSNGNVGGYAIKPPNISTPDENTPPMTSTGIPRTYSSNSPIRGTKVMSSSEEGLSTPSLTYSSIEEETPTFKNGILLYEDENTDVSSSTADSNVGTPSPSEAPRSPFLCEKCDKAFNKACYLTQHNKSFHSGYKPYKCNRCGKRFTDIKQYEDHIEKHAGDKPHKCDICPKQFNHKTDLRRHVCLHTNVRPHTCDLCQKGFIRKDHMLKHRETHLNRRQILRRVKIQRIQKELELEVCC